LVIYKREFELSQSLLYVNFNTDSVRVDGFKAVSEGSTKRSFVLKDSSQKLRTIVMSGRARTGWLKKDGEMVKDGESILMLETDKISTEIPAPGTGVLRIEVEAGQEVKIGQVVATLDQTAKAGSPPASQGETPGTAQKTETVPMEAESVVTSGETLDGAGTELSPAVRRLAEEEKVPLEKVQGTGKHGQVTKEDLVNYLESRQSAVEEKGPTPVEQIASSPTRLTPAPVSELPKESSRSKTDERFTRRKMSPLRKKIAAQLVMAQQNAAMLTTFNEVDMSAVIQLRSRYQENFQKRHGIKLGFMSFFVKAAVDALQSVPAINARLLFAYGRFAG